MRFWWNVSDANMNDQFSCSEHSISMSAMHAMENTIRSQHVLAIRMSVDAIEPVPVHRSVVNFQCRDLYFHKETDHRVSVFRARCGHVRVKETTCTDCSGWIRYRSLLSNNNKMAKHIGSRYLNKHFVPLGASDRHAEADEREKRNKKKQKELHVAKTES